MGMKEAGRIGAAAELLRRGATLLREPCPVCGGVQLRYRGEVVCISCRDVIGEEAAGATEVRPLSALPQVDGLRAILLDKMAKLGNQLQVEETLEGQRELLGLLMDYLSVLEGLYRFTQRQDTGGPRKTERS